MIKTSDVWGDENGMANLKLVQPAIQANNLGYYNNQIVCWE